jgi:hypothetical protein
MSSSAYTTTGILSLLLAVGLVAIGVYALVKKHPQRSLVAPVYFVLAALDAFFGYRLVNAGSAVGTMFFLWWVFFSSITISTLWKTGRAVIQGRDFKEAGIF